MKLIAFFLVLCLGMASVSALISSSGVSAVAGVNAPFSLSYYGNNDTLNLSWSVNGIVVYNSWNNPVNNGTRLSFSLSHSYYVAGDNLSITAVTSSEEYLTSTIVEQPTVNDAVASSDFSISPELLLWLFYIIFLIVGLVTIQKQSVILLGVGVMGVILAIAEGVSGSISFLLAVLLFTMNMLFVVISIKIGK